MSDTQDNEYKSGSGQEEVPVVADDQPVEDPVDAETADSDAQLATDEKDAIDTSNIIDDRTRGAKPSGGYTEPGDDEGLPGPGESGTSAVTGGRS